MSDCEQSLYYLLFNACCSVLHIFSTFVYKVFIVILHSMNRADKRVFLIVHFLSIAACVASMFVVCVFIQAFLMQF